MNHILSNMHNNKHWRGYDGLINLASRTFSKRDHLANLEELKKECKPAYEYLTGPNLPKESWARSYFNAATKCENVSNNWTEAWNAWILETRDKPVTQMVMMIHTLVMKMRFGRQQQASKWRDEEVVPRVHEFVNKVCKHELKDWIVAGSDANTWQVTGRYGNWYIVDLNAQTCSCDHWKHTGMPCVHAISCLVDRSDASTIPWYR